MTPLYRPVLGVISGPFGQIVLKKWHFIAFFGLTRPKMGSRGQLARSYKENSSSKCSFKRGFKSPFGLVVGPTRDFFGHFGQKLAFFESLVGSELSCLGRPNIY